MKGLLPIALICAALLGCNKEENNNPSCPEKTCAQKAERVQTSTGIIVVGKDCENKSLPCKKFCLEHDYQNVD